MTAPGELIGLVLTGSAAARVGVEPFIMELIAGIEEELAPHGITVLVVVVPDLGAELDTYRRWADDRTVQAVVVVNLVHDDVRPGRLAALGLPAVLAGRHRDAPTFAKVVTDDAGAMTAAIEMLASLGHEVIGRVSGPADLVHTTERSVAMRAAGSGTASSCASWRPTTAPRPACGPCGNCSPATRRRPPWSSTTTSWRWPPSRS